MKKKLISILLLTGIIFISCQNQTGEFKVVAQQDVKEFKVSILTPTGTLTHGAGTFDIEIRKSNDDLTNLGKVEAFYVKGPGENGTPIEVNSTLIKGRYEAKYNIPTAGNWTIVVLFAVGRAQI